MNRKSVRERPGAVARGGMCWEASWCASSGCSLPQRGGSINCDGSGPEVAPLAFTMTSRARGSIGGVKHDADLELVEPLPCCFAEAPAQ
jgi:hypothetical protein